MREGAPASKWRAALPAAVVAAAVFVAYASALRVPNVLLHCANALLFAAALESLAVPGAGIAFLIFALHPVHAESVAGAAGPRGLLCASCYLLSFLIYRKSLNGTPRCRLFYAASLALFLCALWSPLTWTLPAAILLALAFKERRVPGLEDVKPLVPFCAAAGLACLLALRHAARGLGADGPASPISWLGHLALAGRIPWFYLGKLVWPSPLLFIYPRWEIDPARLMAWAPAAAWLGAFALAWRNRERPACRAALFALAFFVLTLIPALGCIGFDDLRGSFVVDSFQYLASLGPIALAAAGLSCLPLGGRSVCAAGLSICLIALTMRRARAFSGAEALWKDTLSKNPKSWVAHNSLGRVLIDEGRVAEGLGHVQAALALEPRAARIQDNLGVALLSLGQPQQAILSFGKALSVDPGLLDARFNLGVALDALDLPQEASAQYAMILKADPKHVEARYNYSLDLLRMKRVREALPLLREVLRQNPIPEAHNNLGAALAMAGDYSGAQEQFRKALILDPGNLEAAANLKRLPRRGS